MQPIPQANAMNLKSHKSVLLGTSALVCLALAAPVMADDFVITSGTTTNDGNTINGGDVLTTEYVFSNGDVFYANGVESIENTFSLPGTYDCFVNITSNYGCVYTLIKQLLVGFI